MAHTATGSATELSQPGLDELTSEQAGMASCHPPTFKPEMLADGRKLRGTPFKAPPPKPAGESPPPTLAGDQVNPLDAAFRAAVSPWMPLPPPGTPGPAAESTATPLPVEPERRLATVGTPWKAPPPEIDGPKAPPQGIDGPCYRAGPPSKAPPPGMGDRAGGATDHAAEPSASTATATAADARSAARQRAEEIERGLRALRGITKRVGNWDGEVYARLERFRDAVGREWQYDPLAYEWMYVDEF